jgi:hypothetical protein
MAMAHCNGPLDEHDALPVLSVPVRPEEKQASAAWAGTGATLVANALDTLMPEIVAEQPELMARHLTAADLPERAVGHWIHAAERFDSQWTGAAVVLRFMAQLLGQWSPGHEKDEAATPRPPRLQARAMVNGFAPQ